MMIWEKIKRYHSFFLFINFASLFSTFSSNANISLNLPFSTTGLSWSTSILISYNFLTLFYVLISMSMPTISSVKTTPKVFLLIHGASGLGSVEFIPSSSIIFCSISKFISGGLTKGRQNDSLNLMKGLSGYSISEKMEQSRFVTGKGVKSSGSWGSSSPNSSWKLSYLERDFLAGY